MLLAPTQVSTAQFTWVKSERLLVAEASDLSDMSRVWDDACDVGYTIVSAHTGRTVVYAVHSDKRDAGDLLYQDLRPVHQADQDLPTVRIFND